MKLIKSFALLSLSVALISCNSDSSSGVIPIIDNNNHPTPTPPTPNGGVVGNSGGFQVVKGITKVTIDGKDIDTALPGVAGGSIVYLRGNTNVNGEARWNGYAVSGSKYENVKFGVVRKSSDSPYINFASGKAGTETKQSDLKGTAIYSGDAAHSDEAGKLFTGKSQFNVDFDNKTVDGSLSIVDRDEQFLDKTINVIELKAKIDGNKFKGDATDGGTEYKNTVEGGFFGDGAKELTGAYDLKNNRKGAFGGVKQ